MKRTKRNDRTADEIAREIRSELRNIVKARRDLYSPLQRFERIESNDQIRFYVLFDMNPRIRIKGLRLGGLGKLSLPDDRIENSVLEFAKLVWHLKDRLRQFAKATNRKVDLKAIVEQNMPLRICADLSNKKKHGRNENVSGLNPHLAEVCFDTSQSGQIELYYDGAMKDRELIVEKPVPIPFTVDVLTGDGKTVLGDARNIIDSALEAWVPVVRELNVLSSDNPECKALRSILFEDSNA